MQNEGQDGYHSAVHELGQEGREDVSLSADMRLMKGTIKSRMVGRMTTIVLD